jgi:DNA repair protein RadC
VIVAHNHPCGDVQPSKADEELTQKIKKGAELLELRLLDHLVLAPDHYFSFANNGLLCN